MLPFGGYTDKHYFEMNSLLDYFQKIHKKELICHASGDRQHPFVHGFFLYFFVTGNKGKLLHFAPFFS